MAVFTLTKTIGVGKDYTLPNSWAAGAPASLTTAEKSDCSIFLQPGAAVPFVIGESLTFVGSGATGKLLATDSTGAGTGTYMAYGVVSGNPASSDVITGATSGATCVLTSGTPNFTGVIWRGEMFNNTGSFYATTTDFTGTSSATCYNELTAAAGQSFADNAAVRSNKLGWDQTQGVAFKQTAGYGHCLSVSNQTAARVSRLQFWASSASSSFGITGATIGGTACLFDTCIILGASVAFFCERATVTNCLILIDHATLQAISAGSMIGDFIACTIARTTNRSAAGNGITVNNYSFLGMVSCAAFGFTAIVSNTARMTRTIKNNATDLASVGFGTANQVSVAYSGTSPFTQASNTNTDFRAITGTALAANGFLDSTNAPTDISGLARTAAPTIGCWELDVSGQPTIRRGGLTAHVASMRPIGSSGVTTFAPVASITRRPARRWAPPLREAA